MSMPKPAMRRPILAPLEIGVDQLRKATELSYVSMRAPRSSFRGAQTGRIDKLHPAAQWRRQQPASGAPYAHTLHPLASVVILGQNRLHQLPT